MRIPTDAEVEAVTRQRNDLANFPDALLLRWLVPFAVELGWPPEQDSEGAPSDKWRYRLGRHPLSFWREMRWTQGPVNLYQLPYSDLSRNTLSLLYEAHALGKQNIMSEEIGPGSLERFNSILGYLKQHGDLPVPPVIIFNKGRFEVMDGNHRISAYLHFRLQLGKGADTCAGTLNPEPKVWLGVHPSGIAEWQSLSAEA